jgi:hypothetical protein
MMMMRLGSEKDWTSSCDRAWMRASGMPTKGSFWMVAPAVMAAYNLRRVLNIVEFTTLMAAAQG